MMSNELGGNKKRNFCETIEL